METKQTDAEKAFDAYVKEDYPLEGENGEAFASTCAMDHFLSGYERGKGTAQAKIKGMVEAAKHMIISCRHANTVLSPSGRESLKMLDSAIKTAEAK